jgi:CheY-like chemotaxis protein
VVERGVLLIVDDDEAIRTLLRMALEDEGYSVIEASDGSEALDRIQRQSPQLILLDMRMPRMNGWAFAQAYRALPGPHAPILVMTAAQDAAASARDIGAQDHLAKPFELDDVLRAVARLAA